MLNAVQAYPSDSEKYADQPTPSMGLPYQINMCWKCACQRVLGIVYQLDDEAYP